VTLRDHRLTGAAKRWARGQLAATDGHTALHAKRRGQQLAKRVRKTATPPKPPKEEA
jgi:hypothetical protein